MKTVNLEINENQANYLIKALDVLVRTKGLAEATNASFMEVFIKKAFEVSPETQETIETEE